MTENKGQVVSGLDATLEDLEERLADVEAFIEAKFGSGQPGRLLRLICERVREREE